VLGCEESGVNESFSAETGLLEYPQYTRPESYRGMRVPAVLLSGNHAEIALWRRSEALKRTAERRPDINITHIDNNGSE
jgi:tRNA (guanine37-N1)-methyltransferase